MFPSGPLDFFYAPHNQAASTVMNMTISLMGDPFKDAKKESTFAAFAAFA